MSEQPLKSYIAGRWTASQTSVQTFEAINPATEQRAALVARCAPDDVDTAVAAAGTAFAAFSALSREARGEFGLHDFLEIKVVNGFYPA